MKKKNAGSIRIFRGSIISLHPELDPLLGAATNEGLGSALALGDVNDNGFADIVAGTPKAANPTAVPKAIAATGRVRIYFMDGSSFQVLGESLYGVKKGDLFGASVSAGDIDGDGNGDLVRNFLGFDQASQDASMSGVYAGTQFGSSAIDGASMGTQIGEDVTQNFFQNVPEPSGILLTMLGLGWFGARRRRA